MKYMSEMDFLEAVRNMRHFTCAFKGRVDDALTNFDIIKSGGAESQIFNMLIYLYANKCVLHLQLMSKLLFVDI